MDQNTERTAILDALRAWINQRPGLEFGNYGELQAYRSEQRRIAKQKQQALILLDAVEYSDADAEMLKRSFRAFSGRLAWDGKKLDYCTGQYWPTEYRAAACAVLAAALWEQAHMAMPKPDGKITRTHGPFTTEHDNIDGMTPGDWIRRHFRRRFGASIQRAWFD